MKQSLVRSIIICMFATILAACGGGSGDTAPDEASISSPPIAQCPILSENDALLENCDSDNDGIDDSVDEFPLDKGESFDFDGDGVGDNADTDDDNDAWSDNDEIECSSDPLNISSQPKDNDNDHQCDELDLDDDNDGYSDLNELSEGSDTMDTSSKPIDFDGDFISNLVDSDDDNDGINDEFDSCPFTDDFDLSADFDGDGCDDTDEDVDDDNDGYSDLDELSEGSDTMDASSKPIDFDGDFISDLVDSDDDNDGINDEFDSCPFTDDFDLSADIDGDGCDDANEDTDDDNDGVVDIDDPFPNDAYKVKLPKGIFSSHTEGFTVDSLDNPEARGGLIRVEWETIEPEPGEFDFSEIDLLVQDMKDRKQMWSLGVRTSFHSPTWLADKLGAEYFEFEFDEGYLEQNPDTITSWPKPWDPVVQDRLKILVDELAARYNTDSDLGLVYISQMASKGIEGHLIGVTEDSLAENGVTEESWVNISVATAEMFAAAFTNKALAFEIHDILFSPNAAIRIIDSLWENPELHYRIGAAMWWLSGKTSYQTELLDFMENFEGPIYAQLIGKSSQPQRFENDEFTSVFDQADQLGIRYIEIWNNDMVISDWDEDYALFNEQVDARYSETNAEYLDTDID